jgi:tetratricopeptide (TPR) repeat protein
MNRSLRIIPALLLLIVMVAALFYPLRGYDFLNMDDPFFIERHHVPEGLTLENIKRAFTLHDCMWMPLTWLSHMTDYQLYGSKPAGHHLTNLFIHILNVLLLFLVLRALTGAFYRSWLVAAVFALHPLNVEPVAFIACRKGLLAAFFWLLAILAYTGYARHRSVGRYLLTVLCFFLGLTAKPMPVTLPLVLLLLDYWPLDRFSTEKPLSLLIEKLPLLAISLVLGIVAIITQQEANALPTLSAIPFADRIGNALISYMIYLGRMFWPSGLAIFYPWPQSTAWGKAAAGGLLLLAVTLLVVIRRKKQPFAFSGWFWFVIALVPVIGIIPMGGHAMADRYAYIPGIGIILAVVWTAADILKNRPAEKRLIVLFALCLLTALGLISRRQLGYWQNSETVFRRALAVTTGNYAAHNNLARALVEQGRIKEARTHLDRALAIHPGFPQAHNNLGVLLAAEGGIEAALDHFSRAVAHRPDFAEAHYNMANTLLAAGAPDKALAHYQRVLDIDPAYKHAALIYRRLGAIMLRKRKTAEAAEYLRQALSLDPGHVETTEMLAGIYKSSGRYDAAVDLYRRLLEKRPDCSITITYNLACLFALKNDPETAVSWLKKSIAAGFSHAELLTVDKDLDNIRQAPAFRELIQSCKFPD